MKKTTSSRTLSNMVSNIIKESIKSSLYQNALEEKERQASLGGLDEADDEVEDSESKTMSDEKEKLKKGDITPDDIVSKLNSIRGGKSFKDENIAARLEEYISSLTKAEKVALLAFLKGISQIVTGEIDPENAIGPKTSPADVEMKKSGTDGKKVKLTPMVIKPPSKEKPKAKPAEDTTGPVPITPKKK